MNNLSVIHTNFTTYYWIANILRMTTETIGKQSVPILNNKLSIIEQNCKTKTVISVGSMPSDKVLVPWCVPVAVWKNSIIKIFLNQTY